MVVGVVGCRKLATEPFRCDAFLPLEKFSLPAMVSFLTDSTGVSDDGEKWADVDVEEVGGGVRREERGPDFEE